MVKHTLLDVALSFKCRKQRGDNVQVVSYICFTVYISTRTYKWFNDFKNVRYIPFSLNEGDPTLLVRRISGYFKRFCGCRGLVRCIIPSLGQIRFGCHKLKNKK